jgi:hypothetical protein
MARRRLRVIFSGTPTNAQDLAKALGRQVRGRMILLSLRYSNSDDSAARRCRTVAPL